MSSAITLQIVDGEPLIAFSESVFIMNRTIHIGIASTTSLPGDVIGNLAQITDFARRAQSDGVDLLLTPELSVSGYGPYAEVLATAERAGDGPIYRVLAILAADTGITICAGFVEADGDRRYIAHYAIRPDGAFIVQRKHRVTKLEAPFTPAVALEWPEPDADSGQPVTTQFSVLTVRGVRCAIVICADFGIAGLHDRLAADGIDCVLLPTGAGGQRDARVTTDDLLTPDGRQRYLDILQGVFFPGSLIIDCLAYRRALAAVNLCGYDGRALYHVGHGMIITPMGEVPALIHGLPNLDRQRPLYTHAVIDIDERLP